jgi:TonB-linked SusC/RagA family outer membrane protein
MKKRLMILMLFVVFAFQNAWSQSRTISGIVTEKSGEPLVGVTIFIKGTTTGTVTGVDGNYSLQAKEGDVLVFQFIGMESKEVAITDQTNFNVELIASNVALDEVVAIGYGSVKRKELTGATVSISSDALTKDRVVTSLADALKGKVSGVRITQNSGGPGAGSTINIRGATSVFGDNQPLYVVDGFPVENFDLNADDIASIDVLKDASSTAIYGSRGANGVIIVTTKKGKKGKPLIEVNAKFGVSDLSRRVDMIDNVEWVKQVYEQTLRYTKASDFSGNMSENLDYYQDIEGNIYTLAKNDHYGRPHPYKNHENYRDSTNTDWQDVTLRTAKLQDYRINFSNGTERSSYNVSLNMVDQEGLVPNNKVQKIIGRFNMSQKLTDRLEIVSNTYFTKAKDQGFRDVINVMLSRPAVQPSTGRLDGSAIPGYNDQGLLYGPVEQTEAIDRDTYSSIFQTNLSLNYDITHKLKLTVGGSYRTYAVDREFYTPKTTPYGFNYGGIAEYRKDAVQNMTNENYLTYTETINDHKISVMAGNSLEWNEHKWFGVQNRSFDLENLAFYGMNGGTEPQIPYLGNLQSSLLSFYGRINYSFRDKYFISGTARGDGSSRLAEDHKWDSFQSVGTAWRLSEESFVKDIAWFPTTKIRASWGVAGKQSIAPYQSLSVFATGTGTADGAGLSQIAYPTRVGNPNLSWEKNEEIDFGVDMYFDDGRYSFTADVFRKTTEDLLLNLPVPNYTGFADKATNFGKLRNEGLEMQLNATPIQGDFKWETSLNVTFARSEVMEVGEQGELVLSGIGILREGEAIGEWYGYQQDGIWQSQAEIDAAVANGFERQLGVAAGDLEPGRTRFIDQLTVDTDDDEIPDAGDGEINANDRVLLGKASPDFTGGFYNTFSWKGISFNVGLQFSQGAKIYNSNRVAFEAGRGYTNQTARTADRWVPDLYTYDPANPTDLTLARPGNPGNLVRKVTGNVEDQMIDRNLEDGSFIRLSDISLAYDLPKTITGKMGISSCRFFVTGQNLKLWTKYEGYDPEVNTGAYRSLLPGVDSGAYPREKTIAFGLKLVL